MKRNIIALIGLAVLCSVWLTACKSKQQASSSLTPWLQESVATLNDRYSVIPLYELDGESYYAVFCRGPRLSFDMNRTTIYDADGNVYMTLGGMKKRTGREEYFFNNAIDKGVIWKSDVARQEEQEKEKK